MPKPRVLILRAPGTNCDVETAVAFARAGGEPERLHINRLLENPRRFDQYQILCLPGGFSYGDDVAAGKILANQIRHHLRDAVFRFRDAGKLILGICNGFQVLIKCDVLIEPSPAGPLATLTYNDSGRFEDRWVRLGVTGRDCPFLEGIESLELPVAHGEGKFVARDLAALAALEAAGQLVLRYRPREAGSLGGSGPKPGVPAGPTPHPDNPNGSMADVAGVCDASGRVLGLMPHPERHIDPIQHPRWTRGDAGADGAGLKLFVNAVRSFA